jgi:predicted RNA-binding protein with PIN domain
MNHYIIDGYNALFALKPRLKGSARSREGFLLYLKTARPFGSLRNGVTVVFDGREGVVLNLERAYAPLRVVFSKRESADETIVRIVSKEKHPEQAIVVTDDRELSERVSMLGAKAVRVSDFFAPLFRKKQVSADSKPSPESAEGRTITDAMKKEWNIEE